MLLAAGFRKLRGQMLHIRIQRRLFGSARYGMWPIAIKHAEEVLISAMPRRLRTLIGKALAVSNMFISAEKASF